MAMRITPEVLWAQRSCYSPDSNYVVLTIAIPDVPKDSLKLTLQERKVILDAHSDLKDTHYHLELKLHDDTYPNETEIKHTDRQLELKLFKAEPDYWWPALLSDADVPSYVKQDFDRWINQHAQDGEPDPYEELIADMDRQEFQAMADTALASLPGSEHIVTYTERQSGAYRATGASGQLDNEGVESDVEDDDEVSDNETPGLDDETASGDEDSYSPPGGGGTNGHASSDGLSFHGDSAPQGKHSSRGNDPSTSGDIDKEHSRPSDKSHTLDPPV
ncbi:Prostaglandin E synthase 3 (Cytosolic) [Diplodia seriata]|uniref:Prostaglandin E synthase 3 (Cytosolic) n=1 Tax=Diplodia seriata TaxID=420778 RepID=A0ABR3CAV1_9PEZI